MTANGAVIESVVAAPFSAFRSDLRWAALRRTFAAARPYGHVVMDGFLAPAVARALAREIPSPSSPRWTRRIHRHSHKLTLTRVGPVARDVIDALHAPSFLRWLERVTGQRDVAGDDALFGGGLHCSPPGGFLDVHADFSRHPKTGQQRALNLLIYLTEDWDVAWGGDLELWDAKVRQCVRSIAPTFNRAVLFETHATSFHGHPDPFRGPSRASLALYYYRPRREDDPFVPTTDYRPRPWEYVARFRKWVGRLVR